MGVYTFDYGMQAGPGPERGEIQNQFAWGRRELAIVFGAQIDGAARDAGNTPTTVLRTGLAMGIITGTKYWRQYDPTATDGTGVCQGFLAAPAGGLRMVDIDGNNQAKSVAMIVGGPVLAGRLVGLDALARRHCYNRFVFDDDLPGLLGGAIGAPVVAKTANYTVTAADNGATFTTKGAAGAVTFTLPAPFRGGRYRFVSEAGQNMVVTGAGANQLVTFNNLTASTVTFSTAGNLIGASVEVIANADATKWLVLPSGANTMTVS